MQVESLCVMSSYNEDFSLGWCNLPREHQLSGIQTPESMEVMNDTSDGFEHVKAETSLPSSRLVSASNQVMTFTVIGLIAGAIALGLAVIPAIAFERPVSNPFSASEKIQNPEPPAEREGGFTFRVNSFSIKFGGKSPKRQESGSQPPVITKDPTRNYTISAIGCALAGIVFASIGHHREKHTALTMTSLGLCVAAITWQYIIFGIVVGFVIAALLMALSKFA